MCVYSAKKPDNETPYAPVTVLILTVLSPAAFVGQEVPAR